MVADTKKWITAGILIGAAIEVLVPSSLINRISSSGFPYIAVLLAAVPMYVCATGSIPIAAALVQKGFPPGSAVVFLIAGPATNTVTLSFVKSRLGTKTFYIYLASIIAVSLVFGFITDAIFKTTFALPTKSSSTVSHLIKTTSAVILAGLFVLPKDKD